MLCFEIERKANVISLTALIISLISLIYSLYGFFIGPEINLMIPEQITIKPYRYDGKMYYIRFIVPMVYINSGQIGHNGIVVMESILFNVGEIEREHIWIKFSDTKMDNNGTIIEEEKKSAFPFVVNADSSEVHETSFYPTTSNNENKLINYLKHDEFINEVIKLKNKDLIFKLKYKPYKKNSQIIVFKAHIEGYDLKELREYKTISIPCSEV